MGHTGKITAKDTSQIWNENNTGVSGSTAAGGDRFARGLGCWEFERRPIDRSGDRHPRSKYRIRPQEQETFRCFTALACFAVAAVCRIGACEIAAWNQHVLNSNGDDVSANEAFGTSLTIADFNGDRIGDLAAEAPADVIQGSTTDAANVVFGTGTGLKASGTGSVQDHQIWLASLNEVFFDTALAIKNFNEGEAFLAKNKNKPGVITLPDGLQYKVLSTNPNGREANGQQ